MKPEWMSIAQKPKKKASTKKIIKTSLKEWNYDKDDEDIAIHIDTLKGLTIGEIKELDDKLRSDK
jgi:hypothetical protein